MLFRSVEGKTFYGIISKEMICTFFYEECNKSQSIIKLSDIKVMDIMREDVPKVHPFDRIEEAVQYLEKKRIAFVAVVNEVNEFKGILTHKSVFREFTELFGLDKGKRISVIAFDIPGQISKLTKIISENQGNIISCLVADPKSALDVREIILRIQTDNFDKIIEDMKYAGFKIQ